MVKSLYINHLSWGHDRDKGGGCCGNKCVPDCNRVLVFGGETLHYSIMMLSLCCITNDIMDLPQNYK